MTTSLSSIASSPVDPFAGLTATDAARIATAMGASLAKSIRTVYAHAWRGWERWCTARAVNPLPGSPAAVCAYLVERAEQGASVGTDVGCVPECYCGPEIAGRRGTRRGPFRARSAIGMTNRRERP